MNHALRLKMFLALPVLNEYANLPSFLHSLKEQRLDEFELFVCVNQPDAWWEDQAKREICLDNQQSILYLHKDHGFDIHCIDRSSRGKGWKGKHFGVGWARKTAMDAIDQIAGNDDLIVSMDADTFYPSGYLDSVKEIFQRQPDCNGLANPYYHKIIGEDATDRAILHYEIYMRNYAINMLLVNNPYAFTALGSAIAVPVKAYRKIGGITPHKSGEDFYFLQKLRKTGRLHAHNEQKVYPSARRSDRVFFGTGPAIIKGIEGNWDSYPIYHHELFGKVEETFNSFEKLFERDIDLPMNTFLQGVFKSNNFWQELRDNSGNRKAFARACITKVDALRILQYLKNEQKQIELTDERCLIENLHRFSEKTGYDISLKYDFSFLSSDTGLLDELRNQLFELETRLQRGSA